MTLPRPLLALRVYPDPRRPRWYVRFRVFERRSQMSRATRQSGGGAIGAGGVPVHRMAAVCVRLPKGPMVADVMFCREHLGNGTIAHEIFHAACQWARRLPRRYPGWALLEIAASRYDGRTEEQMARITEQLTREFVAAGHAKGIFK